jgi:ectoine hydroxylase-related dioxygenase (phytanoyl-CoA dioxygenase family)
MTIFSSELAIRGFYFEHKATWLSMDALEKARALNLSGIDSHFFDRFEPGVTRIQQAFNKVNEYQMIINELLTCHWLAGYFDKRPILNFLVLRSPHQGAGAQDVHRDSSTPSSGGLANELVAFIPLDSVSASNGGTIFYPESHYDAELLPIRAGVSMVADPGDVIWMNASLFHAGQANVNGKNRRMLIASICPDLLHPERTDNDFYQPL